MTARETFITRHGVTQPAPAPRFSRTPSAARDATTADLAEVMNGWKASRRP
jgi:alpha-methylacyl-CoA racemase